MLSSSLEIPDLTFFLNNDNEIFYFLDSFVLLLWLSRYINTGLFSFKKNFKFCVGVQLINNIMIVSDKQRRDSAVYTHVSILPQIPFPSRLPHDIEQFHVL